MILWESLCMHIYRERVRETTIYMCAFVFICAVYHSKYTVLVPHVSIYLCVCNDKTSTLLPIDDLFIYKLIWKVWYLLKTYK